MRVYIFSPQVEIAELIADNLTDKENMCIVFPTFTQLYDEIKNSRKYPDLLIFDYMMYNHDNFNIAEFMRIHKIYIPVVWFNEPCIVAATRARHWKAEIKMLQCRDDPDRDLSHFDALFQKLQDLVECEELRPYIPLMQQAKPLPPEYIRNKITLDYITKKKTDFIKQFKDRTNLPDNLYYLLCIFQRNNRLPISLDYIKEEYNKDSKSITSQSLVTMISNLRKRIREDGQCNFYIISEKRKYIFLSH